MITGAETLPWGVLTIHELQLSEGFPCLIARRLITVCICKIRVKYSAVTLFYISWYFEYNWLLYGNTKLLDKILGL
jgi:hypothetical protein